MSVLVQTYKLSFQAYCFKIFLHSSVQYAGCACRNTQATYFKYLGNKDTHYIFKLCCKICILFPLKCSVFHNFISRVSCSCNLFILLLQLIKFTLTGFTTQALASGHSYMFSCQFFISIVFSTEAFIGTTKTCALKAYKRCGLN
jgi:hypothetical protein